jgi:hypothetical protein
MTNHMFARGSMALGALTAALVLGDGRAGASVPGDPDMPAFGLIGLAAGQTARINVSHPGSRLLPPDPCRVRLSFVDGAGTTLAAIESLVAPNQSVHLDVDAAVLARTSAGGLAVRPIVAAIGNPNLRPGTGEVGNPDLFPGTGAIGNPDLRPGVCVATLEVFDSATGVTSVLSSPSIVRTRPGADRAIVPGPPDEPLFGALGLAAGQRVRLNAVHPGGERGAPPDPCRGDLSFVDETGARLAGVSFVATADRAASFEFDASSSTRTSGGRVSVRPVVSAVGNPDLMPSGSCIYTVEVVNAATGATTLFSPATHAGL